MGLTDRLAAAQRARSESPEPTADKTSAASSPSSPTPKVKASTRDPF